MKWLRYLTIFLIGFGLGIILTYLIQGHPTFETVLNFILGGSSLGLIVEVGEVFRQWLKDNKEERKEMIKKLIEHAHDLLPDLEKWASQPLMSFSLYAKQHIETGYGELWNLLEGEDNGIKALETKYYLNDKNIDMLIENTITNKISEELPKFKIEHLEWFVEDIKDFLEKKRFENKLYIFKVVTDTSTTPYRHFIYSERSDSSVERSPYQTGTKENLEKLEKIMNNILNDAQLQGMLMDLHDLGKQLYNAREAFSRKMNIVINNITYAVSDEDKILLGVCDRCKQIKKKLKMD